MTNIQVCSFCQVPVYPGKGITFVRNDGTVFRFCTGKCNRAFKMKRNPRRVKHTMAYRAAHGKVLLNDPAFLIEKKRNRPVRYKRELWENAQIAIDKLAKIQYQRKLRAAAERKRAHAIRVLSCKKAREMGFSADLSVPIPAITKLEHQPLKSVTKIRTGLYKKLDIAQAKKIAKRMQEIEFKLNEIDNKAVSQQ